MAHKKVRDQEMVSIKQYSIIRCIKITEKIKANHRWPLFMRDDFNQHESRSALSLMGLEKRYLTDYDRPTEQAIDWGCLFRSYVNPSRPT